MRAAQEMMLWRSLLSSRTNAVAGIFDAPTASGLVFRLGLSTRDVNLFHANSGKFSKLESFGRSSTIERAKGPHDRGAPARYRLAPADDGLPCVRET